MANISATGAIANIVEATHRIHVRLFPSKLPPPVVSTSSTTETTDDAHTVVEPVETTSARGYVARVQTEGVLSVEQTIANLIVRTNFQGEPREMARIYHAITAEQEYSLADGWSVDTGFAVFSVRVGGLWRSPSEAADRAAHPVTFRVRIKRRFKALAENIALEVVGRPGAPEGTIYTVWAMDDAAYAGALHTDPVHTDADLWTLSATPGGILLIRGDGLKVTDNPKGTERAGVYFIDNAGNRTAGFLVHNGYKRLKVIVPPTLPPGGYTISVVTYHTCTHGTTVLDKARLVESPILVQVDQNGQVI
jgi:hypothetical protein